jgi:hypothetical protein
MLETYSTAESYISSLPDSHLLFRGEFSTRPQAVLPQARPKVEAWLTGVLRTLTIAQAQGKILPDPAHGLEPTA